MTRCSLLLPLLPLLLLLLLLLPVLVLTRHYRYVSLFVLIVFAARLFCKHKRCQFGGLLQGTRQQAEQV